MHRSMLIIAVTLESIRSDVIGGSDRVFLEIFKKLLRNNVQVIIITSITGYKLFRYNCKLNAKYFIVSRTKLDALIERKYSKLLVFITYIMRILKMIISLKSLLCLLRYADNNDRIIIYTPGDFMPNAISAGLLRILIKKSFWATHIHFLIPPPLYRGLSLLADLAAFSLQRISLHIIKKIADMIIVVNFYVHQRLIKLGVPKSKIFRSNCGIDYELIQKVPPVSCKYDACFVGRIHPAKGVFDLIKIWEKVVKLKKNAKLAIVGSGSSEYVNALISIVRKKDLHKNIFLLGFDPLPYRVMKSSAMLLYPDHEAGYGWGIAIAEALACGIPVIAYSLPVYKEIYDDVIWYVKYRDYDEFADKILLLLENKGLRSLIGNRGREYVKRYDWSTIVNNLLCEIMRRISRET